ncbi:MAG: trypsin-like peptidase domain-containing protein [Bacteroidetes bacterium]|nr:trypsin-like peptidase domain-containing protein [Bacteroidota bacterium]
MIKSTIVLLGVLFSIPAYSQDNIDSLDKYSYSIVGDCAKGRYYGTGFFISDNNRLFFITAKHCLTGCDGETKNSIYPDTMFINLKIRKYYPLDVRITKDTSICDHNDYMVIEVDTVLKKVINTLENLIPSKTFKPLRLKIVGYPRQAYPTQNPLDAITQNLTLSYSQFFIDADKSNYISKYNINTERIIFLTEFVKDSHLDGYSGAPVFFQDYSLKWKLIGCLHSGGWGADSNYTSGYFQDIFSIKKDVRFKSSN